MSNLKRSTAAQKMEDDSVGPKGFPSAILDVFQWMAAGVAVLPIYFAIESNIPKLIISLVVAFSLILTYLLLRKVPLSDMTLAPDRQGTQRHRRKSFQLSRCAYLFANAFTFVRPAVGIAAGLAVARGNTSVGFSLFLVGSTTDVLDGMIARIFHVQSAHGRKWDAVADAIHNGAFGVGLAWAATQAPLNLMVLVVLAACSLVFLVSRLFVPLHSAIDKCLSGLWRVVLFFLAYSLLAPNLRLAALVAGALLATLGGTYEVAVLVDEVRRGKRSLWRQRHEQEVSS